MRYTVITTDNSRINPLIRSRSVFAAFLNISFAMSTDHILVFFKQAENGYLCKVHSNP